MRTREEQAIDMAVAIEGFEKPSELLVKLMRKELNEAERRGYERARAEYAADTRRLEWLEKLPFADVGRLPNGWEICINNVRHWDMQPTLREAIDAAMDGGK